MAPVELRVGEQEYRYDRSYPVRGHGAVLPKYLREQMAGGRRPLVAERGERFYIYFAK